jgi:drug/metabolite transporter (DMT)-like permease
MRPGDAARLTLLASIWGSSYLFIKVALDDLTPLQIVTARLWLGAAVLLLISFSSRIPLLQLRSYLRPIVVMAIFASIVPWLLITWGEERVSSGLASILNSTTPLFTVFIAALFVSGEPLNKLRLAGIVLGFLGVTVIVGGGGSSRAVLGAVAVTLSSLSYGIGFVFARLHLATREHSVIGVSTAQLSVGAVLMLPAAAWDVAAHTPRLHSSAALCVIALGTIGTGIAYLLYYRLIGDVGATTASFVTYLIPVIGVVLGFLVLDERVGWNTLLGSVLVIAGIAVSERGAKRAASKRAVAGGTS